MFEVYILTRNGEHIGHYATEAEAQAALAKATADDLRMVALGWLRGSDHPRYHIEEHRGRSARYHYARYL
jgi:hypothetical protein